MGKITFGPAQMIALDKLVASAASVRRIGAGMSLVELADDIGRRGLLHSLSVRPVLDEAGAETGRYAVVAGGRRLAALQMLVRAKKLNKTTPIPCTIGRAAVAAEEDSLAENTMREALHPLDQYRAFRVLREERGLGEEEIAAHFFVTPAVVRQRLRLAAVSPKLQDLYAEGGLTLEQLMAFAAATDHPRQEAAWDALCRSHTREPWAIRRLLAEDAVRASDKRALFVGVASYEAAGGVVERDLFDEDGGGYLRDPGLLTRLVEEKLQAEAERVRGEGWLWVDASAELPYGHLFGLRRLSSEPVPLGEELQAEHDRLRAEADALEAEYATAEDMPEAADRTLTALGARLAEITAQARAFDPAEVARAGAFVSIGHDGALSIERGYVRPADEPPAPEAEGGTDVVDPDVGGEPSASGSAAPAAARTQGDEALHGTPEPDEDEPDVGGRLPERLMTELTAHRTLALRGGAFFRLGRRAAGAAPCTGAAGLLRRRGRHLPGGRRTQCWPRWLRAGAGRRRTRPRPDNAECALAGAATAAGPRPVARPGRARRRQPGSAARRLCRAQRQRPRAALGPANWRRRPRRRPRRPPRARHGGGGRLGADGRQLSGACHQGSHPRRGARGAGRGRGGAHRLAAQARDGRGRRAPARRHGLAADAAAHAGAGLDRGRAGSGRQRRRCGGARR